MVTTVQRFAITENFVLDFFFPNKHQIDQKYCEDIVY